MVLENTWLLKKCGFWKGVVFVENTAFEKCGF
jgi:hypothetical protein